MSAVSSLNVMETTVKIIHQSSCRKTREKSAHMQLTCCLASNVNTSLLIISPCHLISSLISWAWMLTIIKQRYMLFAAHAAMSTHCVHFNDINSLMTMYCMLVHNMPFLYLTSPDAKGQTQHFVMCWPCLDVASLKSQWDLFAISSVTLVSECDLTRTMVACLWKEKKTSCNKIKRLKPQQQLFSSMHVTFFCPQMDNCAGDAAFMHQMQTSVY